MRVTVILVAGHFFCSKYHVLYTVNLTRARYTAVFHVAKL